MWDVHAKIISDEHFGSPTFLICLAAEFSGHYVVDTLINSLEIRRTNNRECKKINELG